MLILFRRESLPEVLNPNVVIILEVILNKDFYFFQQLQKVGLDPGLKWLPPTLIEYFLLVINF